MVTRNSPILRIRSFVQTGDDVAIGGFILGGVDNGPEVIFERLGRLFPIWVFRML